MLASILIALLWGVDPQEVRARVHENHLRTKAVASFMPKFPEAARREKVGGVAIAQVTVNHEGRVSNVEVLEAPHPSIKEAVREALYRWRFSKFAIKGKPLTVRGKLTFYFVNVKTGARVENPRPW
jgi:TonB family protein